MNVQPEFAAPKPLMSERRVGVIGAMLIALGPVSMALLTPAMPELVRHFGTTEAAVKMTISLYFAGFAFAQLVCGPMSDGLGRKPVTIAFMALYLAGTVLALLAPTIEILVAARVLQGAGAAVGVAISRAIIRDLFTDERAARIMNLMGIMLAAGPAFAPTLGGITMELAGWEALFVLMLAAGIGIILVTLVSLRETVRRDLSRFRPRALLRSYGALLADRYFMLSSITLACSVGVVYTLASVLPFILMGRIGMSPTGFGFGMLMQSGFFFIGSLVVRSLMGRFGAFRIVPAGLVFIGIGSLLTAILLRIDDPSFMTVMAPVGVYAFGIAFVMPAMSIAAMAPFPHMAGAAASMSGFLQMGAGLVGGMLAALFGDPVLAMATVVPAMGLVAILSYAFWTRLPVPVLARVVPVVPDRPDRPD